MSASHSGNHQRGIWRLKCRQALAEHLNNKGFTVDPASVRLKPDIQDIYDWSFLLEREHLFLKQLSKHSIGAYMELFREVGKSFEAVPRAMDSDVDSHGSIFYTSELEDKNAALEEELQRMKGEVEIGVTERSCIKCTLQENLFSLDTLTREHRKVKKENRRLRRQLERINHFLGRSQKDASKMLKTVSRSGV